MTAHHGPNTGEKFRDGKRLGQIIVGARVQAFHALLHQTSCGKHEDGTIDGRIPQFATDFNPTQTREANVKQDAVISTTGGHF